MGIRIDRISLARGGPLASDLVFEAGDVNLVYGKNETGKTYIVESLISLLFRTRGKSTIEWGLRNWDFSGKVIVSGLSDKPVSFSKTGRKLDDYWQETVGLPRDFSRLLVVKAGESVMVREGDGVGHELLRSYLSGESLLGRIEERIPPTLRNATVQNGQVSGPSMGDIRERSDLMAALARLKVLSKEVEETYANGVVFNLRKRLDETKRELDSLRKAKRHFAASISRKQQATRHDIERLPTEEELSRIESDISVYENESAAIRSKIDLLSALGKAIDNYVWTDKALGVYKEIMSVQNVSGPKRVFFIVALVSMAVAVVTGLLHLSIPLAVFGAGAVVSSVLYYASTRRAAVSSDNSSEMENLKVDYRTRYGDEPISRTGLEARREGFQADYFRALGLAKELEEQLKPKLRTDEDNIKATVRRLTGKDSSPEQWRSVISGVRTELNRLRGKVNSYGVILATLAVSETDYLEQDPGVHWDKDRFDELERQAAETETAIRSELEKLDMLRARIVQETASESNEWEDLISALQNKQGGTAERCRQSTARILAKLQIYTAIKEFRQEEDDIIAKGLGSEELSGPLRAITGRYRSIQYEDGNGLILTTDREEEYSLTDLSTGAREQVLLALRVGFSSIAMRGQTAFLILDDAFQHSDWQRRGNLVGQIANLVDSGWQVFYFTMDDHIRGLFADAGNRFGERFKYVEL
jgi:hypothetical protein